MSRFFQLFFLGVLLLTGTAALPLPGGTEALKVPEFSSNKVFYLPQFSEFEAISDNEMRFFRKTLKRAEQERAKAVILELDTPGGNVETAFKYLSVMEKSTVPIVVYLNPNGISAGMIIAMGADRAAISPNGLIGDAMPIAMGISGAKPVTDKPLDNKTQKPVEPEKKNSPDKPAPPKQEQPQFAEELLKEIRKLQNNSAESAEEKAIADQKFLSVFFKMLQVLAEKNGRPVNVIRAMADPYTELYKKTDGIEHHKRSPLTLSAREAKRLKVVDHIAENRHDLLTQLGLSNAEIVEIKRTATEQIGLFLATPAIAGLLLVIGLVGIFVEIKTPGFGVPGVLGITALTLFFLGHIASGASDWGPMVVFFVGLLLVALEIFVIPGFGLVGVLGILCILVSFFWAFGLENISTALRVVTLSLTAAITVMVVLAIYVLPKTPLFKKVTLDAVLSSGDGCQAQTADNSLIGASAVALTPLRPAGSIRIGNTRHDAASEGDYLEPGEEVIVTACNGFQLIVRKKDV